MSGAMPAHVRRAGIFRILSALLLTSGVLATAAIEFGSPAYADTPPTIANGTGAFSTDPVVNLTGCTAATKSETLTCTSTSGVVANEGIYGASIASGTSVSSVTSTTITISANTSAAITSAQVLTFTTRTAVQNVTGSTSSTTVTSTINFANAGVDPGFAVVGAGIANGTSVTSVSSTSIGLSSAPTAALSGETLVFNAPDNFDALTLVSGGASSVNPSSLTVVTQPPAGDGFVTVSASSSHGILDLLPGDNATSAFTATFAYCAPGDAYSPGSPNCTTATMNYAPAVDQNVGDDVSVDGISEDIYEEAEVAVVAPATAQQNTAFTVTAASVAASVPASESTPVGTATINYADGFTTVLPVPSGLTYVPNSIKVTGGDTTTEGVATAEFCTAAGTGCDAQVNTGNYKTTYPYLEIELPTSDQVAGGDTFTLPTVSAQFTASGSVGSTASETLSEFRVNTNVTVPIIGTQNANFDGYPTTGNSGTPPYAAPVALATTQIVAQNVASSITSGANTTFTVGSAGTFTVTTSGNPTATLSETGGLPSGVTFTDNGNGTASLAGTPASGTGGTYPITIGASNGVGSPASQSFTLTVNQAPAITSGSSTTFIAGSTGNFVVRSTGFPVPTLSESGALPNGVTFVNNGNGTATLAGTPGPSTGGTYPITTKATNGVGNPATQSFILTVDQAPAITSSDTASFTTGSSNSFSVTTTGFPAPALSEVGALPEGVTFTDNGNGTATLAGVPAAGSDGGYPLTLTADNGVGTAATQSFTLTISDAPLAPTFTSGSSTTFTAGSAGSFTITTTGNPIAALSKSGALPSGVTFTDNGDGTATLSGTPAPGAGGTYPLTLTATNGVGSPAHQSFTLVVDEAPSVISSASTTFTTGVTGNFSVTTGGFPAPSLSETGALPSGVAFTDNGDGTATLAGKPDAGTGGSYSFSIDATNGVGGDAIQSFTLTIDQPAAVTSAASTTFTTGSNGAFTVTTTGNPTAALAKTGALPSGVTFTDDGDGTATLAGTPAAGYGGSYPLTITATNGVGTAATQSFTLTVDQPAAITSAASTTFTAGSASTFTVKTSGTPAASLSESGPLPGGVTFTDNGNGTASLAGTAVTGSGGTYSLSLTAANGVGGTASQTFSLTVDEAPSITSADSTTFAKGAASRFTVTATGFPTPTITEWGTLPKGITATNGVLKGTPTKKGSFQVLFTASNGVTPNAYQIFTVNVVTLGVSTTSLPTLTEGTAYSQQLAAQGGLPPYKWKATSPLPTGLTLSKAGVLSGTVISSVSPGTYPITVTVTDSTTPTKGTASATLSLTIQAG